MSFEEFCEEVVEHIREYLPEEYSEARIQTHAVEKINLGSLEALSIMLPDTNVCPTIYLMPYYEEFCDSGDMGTVLHEIAEKYEEASENKVWEYASMLTDFSEAKHLLTVSVVNAKNNMDLLRTHPHTYFLDMAVIYELAFTTDPLGPGVARVSNETLNLWGVSRNEVHKWAWENKLKKDPPALYSIENVMASLLTDFIPKTDLLEEAQDISQCDHFVFSNRELYGGASAILYPEKLEQIRNLLGEDFYLVPTSLHEFMVLRKSFTDSKEGLQYVLKQINQADPTEFLSNNIYEYNGEEKRLMISIKPGKTKDKPKYRDEER